MALSMPRSSGGHGWELLRGLGDGSLRTSRPLLILSPTVSESSALTGFQDLPDLEDVDDSDMLMEDQTKVSTLPYTPEWP